MASGIESSPDRELAREVESIVAAGHLKPGYFRVGNYDNEAWAKCGSARADYWANPAETVYALLRALPHLAPDLRARTKAYVRAEFEKYPPWRYTHVGWRDGAFREAYDYPADVRACLARIGPGSFGWKGAWSFNPFNVYACYLYAGEFGGAGEILGRVNRALKGVPDEPFLRRHPNALNAHIAGRFGLAGLIRLAGEEPPAEVTSQIDALLRKRADILKADPGALAGSEVGGFLYLVPELGDWLNSNALDDVRRWVGAYEEIMPYWFEARSQESIRYRDTKGNEGSMSPLTTCSSIFQAKALALKEPRAELERWLDVPACETGDLYYTQNLCAVLEAKD
jgi:hypothetical protein